MTRAFRSLATPKGLALACLSLLAVVAGRVEGPGLVLPGLGAAVGLAVILDAPLVRWRAGRWVAPTGALITGLLVAMVLSPREAPHVFAAAVAIAIAAKHLFRTRHGNVFNPAALGLVVVYYLFDPGQSWWGALPAIERLAATPLLLGAGALMAHRVRRVPLVLTFLFAFLASCTTVAFMGDPAAVADIFVPPDLYAVLFFSGFMLTDPPTTPARRGWQVACGAMAGFVSVAVFLWVGAAHYLLSGLLAGNLLDAARRLASTALGQRATAVSRNPAGFRMSS